MIAARSGRIVPVGLAAALVLAAVGCAAGDDATAGPDRSDSVTTSVSELDAASGPSTPSAAVTLPADSVRCDAASPASEIIVWHALSNDAESKLVELTERFNQLDTGVTVRLERSGNYAESVARLAAVPAEERPDALMSDAKELRDLFDSGLVIPPTECEGVITATDLVPVIASSYSIDGNLQAAPYNVSVPALVFDATLFRAAGLDPNEPPQTLEALGVAAQTIVESGAAPHGFVAWDGYGPWFVTQYNSRVGELSGFPGNGRDGQPVADVDFATARIVESFDWLRGQAEAGHALWIGGNPSGTDDLVRLIDRVDGAAMTITTSGAVGDLARLLESGAFDDPETGSRPELGVAPMPGPGTGALVGGGAFFLLDRGDPARAGAAASFLSWLTDPAQHADFAASTGFSPIRESELDEPVLQSAWSANPQLRVGFDVLAGLPPDAVRSGPAWGAGAEIDRLLYETLTLVMEGADSRTSLQSATDQADNLLEVYNASIDD